MGEKGRKKGEKETRHLLNSLFRPATVTFPNGEERENGNGSALWSMQILSGEFFPPFSLCLPLFNGRRCRLDDDGCCVEVNEKMENLFFGLFLQLESPEKSPFNSFYLLKAAFSA